VKQIACDIGDIEKLEKLSSQLEEVETIFHIAAKVAMWGKYQDFYQANFLGTKTLLESAKRLGVGKFIYTSSPSVVANGKDLLGVDESQPYPEHYEADYPATKALAEKLVLSENSKNLKSVSLRPHLIYGPGDTNLIPTIVKKARTGRLVQVGMGENLSDFSYIDDVVEAHLLAEKALADNQNAAGRAYFVTAGDPVPLWDFIAQLLKIYRLPPIKRKISFKLAYRLAYLAEGLGRLINREPFLTRFLVSEMATSHFFNINSARDQLKYTPKFKVFEGLEKVHI